MNKITSSVLGLILVLGMLPGLASATGILSLSQTSLFLNIGTTSTVTAFTTGGQVANISLISNSAVATATVFNNTITVFAQGAGSAQIGVCTSDNSCNTINVSVGNTSGSNFGSNQIGFSQNNISLSSGQTQQISVFSTNGSSLFISSNSNSNIATVSISGNTLFINAINSGIDTITVCDNFSHCGFFTLTVNGNGNNFGGNISFSQSNVFLNVNQNTSVTIFGGSQFNNTFFISSNTNSNVVSGNISGSSLNLFGLNSGSSTLTVCGSSNFCGSIFVTVSGNSNSGSISLSQTSVNLGLGNSTSITVFNNNGNQLFISSNSNSTIVTPTLSGNTLNLFGLNVGTSVISICTSFQSQCASVTVFVGGSNNSGSVSFSQTSVNLTLGQNTSVSIFGNNSFNNNFFVSSNSNPSSITASVSGSTLFLTAVNTGSSTISICQTNGGCGNVFVSVNTIFNNNGNGSLFLNQSNLFQLTVGQFFQSQLQVTGGSAPYTFTIISGSLPSGLSLSSSGLISGTPFSTAASSVTILVRDVFGNSNTTTITFSPTNNGGGSVLGATFYQNGTLVNDGGTIYITYKNTKSAFSNFSAFIGLGYKPSNVIVGSTQSLFNSGFIIGTSAMAHPWGSWIKNGSTIYFVDSNGLIPVPDWNTFINNGGNPALVVNANQFDFGKPLETVMTQNDSRLR